MVSVILSLILNGFGNIIFLKTFRIKATDLLFVKFRKVSFLFMYRDIFSFKDWLKQYFTVVKLIPL